MYFSRKVSPAHFLIRITIFSLCFCFSISLTFPGSRPLFQRSELGLHQSGFSGGGGALPSGVNSIFINPAGMEIKVGEMLEAGFIGISSGFSPYFLFGGRVSDATSYTLGYFSDGRKIPQFQGLTGGFTLSPGQYLTTGVSAYGISVNNQYGVDLSAGTLYRFGWIKFGFSGHDLLESGAGLIPEGYATKRNFQTSLALYSEKNRRAGLFYDTGWKGILPKSLYQVISLGAFLGHRGNVGVFGSGRLESGSTTFGLGIIMDLPLGIHEIGMGYSLNNVPFDAGPDNISDITHSIAFRFHFSSNLDIKAPHLWINTDKATISPANTEEEARMHFQMTVTDNAGRISSWALVICTSDERGKGKEIVRSFSGNGLPPRSIRWEGTDAGGMPLDPGIYAYRLVAVDETGNSNHTQWQIIEIR